jgi:hypothetical protein
MSLITLWIEKGSSRSKIILDSGSTSHIFNDKLFFDQVDLGNFDSIRTGKENTNLQIKGHGRVILQWGKMKVALEDCLYVLDIVFNLISPGTLDA